MSNKFCGTCKHYFVGPQYTECHRYPIKTTPFLIGLGPKTGQFPNGTPVMHLDVRYDLTNANTPSCGEWGMRLEVVQSMDEAVRAIPGNANGGHMP